VVTSLLLAPRYIDELVKDAPDQIVSTNMSLIRKQRASATVCTVLVQRGGQVRRDFVDMWQIRVPDVGKSWLEVSALVREHQCWCCYWRMCSLVRIRCDYLQRKIVIVQGIA
jgi:hypothetical protein